MSESTEAVAALDEPSRRRVYDFVVRRSVRVSRDDVATALDLPRSTAAFHLDRLAKVGLLEVAYERVTGRAGPGAGRPTKWYHRSSRQVAVTLPPREYELASRLLAAALAEADRTGDAPRPILERRARELGHHIGHRPDRPESPPVDAVLDILEQHGFEPHSDGDTIVLNNCPFHELAKQQTELVCGMNLHLLQGVLAEAGDGRMTARLVPSPRHCCVRIRIGTD